LTFVGAYVSQLGHPSNGYGLLWLLII